MKRPLSVALVATLAFLGTACGDDDDTTSPATGEETSGSTTSAPADEGGDDGEQAAGDFCTAYIELLAGDPEPDQIREVAADAPEAAAEQLEVIAAGFEEDPEGFFDSPEFTTAFAELNTAANEECAEDVIDVTAVDYAFEGVPTEVSPGLLGVNLTNGGQEFHEMIVFRKNDDATESFEEIFAMEESAAEGLVTEVGATFVAPGQSSGGLFDVSEPGEYAAVCFIPVGSTSPEAESEGPPHVSQGMLAQFTVG